MDFQKIARLATQAETIKHEITTREQSIRELKDGLQGIEHELRALMVDSLMDNGPLVKVFPERKCIQCGCTDSRACLGELGQTCYWHTTTPPLCSECHRLALISLQKPLPNWVADSELDAAGWVPEPETATPATGIEPSESGTAPVRKLFHATPSTPEQRGWYQETPVVPMSEQPTPPAPKVYKWRCSRCQDDSTERPTPQLPGNKTTKWICNDCRQIPATAGEKKTNHNDGDVTPRGFARELVLAEMARLAKQGQSHVPAAALIAVQQKHGVVFDTARTQIASWVDRGLLVRVARGVFSLPGASAAKPKREPETEEQ